MAFNLESLGEMLAAKLIGQDPETGQIPQPKAHEAIDGEIDKWSLSRESMPQEHQDILNNILEGIITGGMGGTIKTMGGTIKTGGKLIQKVLSKIKARNLKGLENLRKGQGTGAQSMSPSNREFINKEWADWRKLKDKRGPSSPDDSETYMNMLKGGGGLGLAGLIRWFQNRNKE